MCPRGQTPVGPERRRVGEVGLRAAGGGRPGRPGGSRGQVGCGRPAAGGPRPGKSPGASPAPAGKPPSPQTGGGAARQSHVGGPEPEAGSPGARRAAARLRGSPRGLMSCYCSKYFTCIN
ncbi:unnamed protein product [Nyctereutes procyonoides]|uniref:(raccoon dog) hypothetical protein n=1 Tax=Nyctereutes procyonoides TaxID=34880 RepID=A0A811ZGS6_NYCPR|nr:unnamed protein product [Nyctereutes procyonoides]